jgi:serine phosphatase RsbU (regulator of sigma subunit)
MSAIPPPLPSTKTTADLSTPRLGDLARAVRVIAPDTPVLEVLDLFHRKEDLLAVPLLDRDGRYLGIVSRRAFLTFMSRAYAREVYTRKPISAIVEAMPEVAATPVSPGPDDRVDRVLLDYLGADPGMFYDALPVVAGGRILGIVAIADMMLSLSESQGKLLGAVQSLSDRLKREVALAAQLQRQLLPPSDIALPGVRGLATLITSSEVGGDYYDCYTVEGRHVVLMIGDVSGHGVAAGTLVSAVKAGVNLLASSGERHPERILDRLNATLLNTAQQTLYMTLFVAALDTQTGKLGYANAGHQFPYLFRNITGAVDMLEAGGLPLGKSAGTEYVPHLTHMDLGDRLFLYTDGLLEEPDAQDEPFGYDRLESVVKDGIGGDIEALRDRLLEELTRHAGGAFFEDDVTIFCVEFHERPQPEPDMAAGFSDFHEPSLVRLPESWYRANDAALSPYISRQALVFLAESKFADLLPRFSRDGIRRVLPRHQPFIQRLGWETLIHQHESRPTSDLAVFLGGSGGLWRDFHLLHSDDKAFVLDEGAALLEETGIGAEYLDAAVLMMDELLENGLYAAPKNGKGLHLYAKGERRALAEDETLSLRIALRDGILGLAVVDSWGTLTPATFLDRLASHQEGEGLIPGWGGAGFYLIWRLADYLQIRVYPHHQTQLTLLFDLNRPLDPEKDKGFQFLFHTEVHEATRHVSSYPAYPAGNPG